MIYLDNAATSFPKPPCVAQEMMDCINHYCGNPGRSGHRLSMKTAEKIYATRETLMDFFHFSNPEKIIFTLNTTEALNLAIKGLLCPGDHVITTSMEHNSVLRPLFSQEKITVSIVQADMQGHIHPAAIEKEIRPNTKLIVCTHSSNVTGTILPIKEIGQIARAHKIFFLVDAAQSAGTLPIDFHNLPVDLMAFAGHKSLLGPQGTGFLYINGNIPLIPIKDGGTGTESKSLIQPRDYPEGFEAGTVNSPGIIGLGAGVRFLQTIGISAIRQKETELTHILYSELKNIKNVIVYGSDQPWEKTSIVSFNLKDQESEKVAAILNRNFGIACRAGFHCSPLAHKTIGSKKTGTVRLSPGYFTTIKDINLVVYRIHQLASGNFL